MERTPEPELMEDVIQARAYAQADFSESNQWFVDHLVAALVPTPQQVVDFGCGPADVLIRLARARPELHVTGIDGSAAMIALARAAVGAAGLEHQVHLIEGYIPGTPSAAHCYDVVLSKDFLHHLPDPSVLWQETARVGKAGAVVYVMDLTRPASAADARAIVASVAPNEQPILKEDFFNSLLAAFTLGEVEEQLRVAGLDLRVEQVSDRHMLIAGRL
jgi:ubiquinone/menaquinone biosynthesis C-methylase UbiE